MQACPSQEPSLVQSGRMPRRKRVPANQAAQTQVLVQDPAPSSQLEAPLVAQEASSLEQASLVLAFQGQGPNQGQTLMPRRVVIQQKLQLQWVLVVQDLA